MPNISNGWKSKSNVFLSITARLSVKKCLADFDFHSYHVALYYLCRNCRDFSLSVYSISVCHCSFQYATARRLISFYYLFSSFFSDIFPISYFWRKFHTIETIVVFLNFLHVNYGRMFEQFRRAVWFHRLMGQCSILDWQMAIILNK